MEVAGLIVLLAAARLVAFLLAKLRDVFGRGHLKKQLKETNSNHEVGRRLIAILYVVVPLLGIVYVIVIGLLRL